MKQVQKSRLNMAPGGNLKIIKACIFFQGLCSFFRVCLFLIFFFWIINDIQLIFISESALCSSRKITFS